MSDKTAAKETAGWRNFKFGPKTKAPMPAAKSTCRRCGRPTVYAGTPPDRKQLDELRASDKAAMGRGPGVYVVVGHQLLSASTCLNPAVTLFREHVCGPAGGAPLETVSTKAAS
jgi:hypothetical protein